MLIKKEQIKILVFSIAIALFSVCFVDAATTDNVSGWAWSSNAGWISFNCTDRLAETCGVSPYGVNVRTDNYVSTSSAAWSSNIGWISFDQAVTGNLPAYLNGKGYDYTGFNYLAKLETVGVSPAEFRGWARACGRPVGGGSIQCGNADWDGWINLSSTKLDTDPSRYKITADFSSVPHAFSGWAWGDDVVGWLSVNCSDPGVCGSGAGKSDYRVIMADREPSANNLNLLPPDYCVSSSQPVSWVFTDPDPGDSQIAYQVQVDQDSDFLIPDDDSLRANTSSQTYQIPAVKLDYGRTYHWRVMVWDNSNVPSVWINGPDFITPPHAYPMVEFTFSPISPTVGEQVFFSENSTVYGVPPTEIWNWTFTGGTPVNSAAANPVVIFDQKGTWTATLEVRDIDNFSCSVTESINVRLPSPEYRETIPSPMIWLRNSLAAISSFVGNVINIPKVFTGGKK